MSESRSSKADAALRLNRQMTMNKLRERYAKFGDRVVQFLFDKTFQRGGIRPILSRVLRPLPLDEDRMHEALARFLINEGVEAFFARIDPEGAAEEGKAQKSETKKRSIEAYRPKIVGPARNDDDSWRAPMGAIAKTGAPEQPGAPVEPILMPMSPLDPGPWHGVERRSGLERRSGKERRTGKDRRAAVDVIYKNRRFGGDRRSRIERRSGIERRQS